jgi:RNA polymerase sigma-70 factor (ECF subfamily)
VAPITAQRRLRLVTPPAEPGVAAGVSASPESRPDEASVLAGLERRDRDASLLFYERARPIVDRTLCRLLGARDPDYEDLAQVALYELVSTLEQFRRECPLDAWLSIVTARVVYRHIRRRRLERRFLASTSDEHAAPVAPAAFASRQAVDRVRRHLGRMDPKRAWAFLLHDVYGYDLTQIAQIMGSSVSAAQSRLVRGRREVHERIAKDPELSNCLDDLSEVP